MAGLVGRQLPPGLVFFADPVIDDVAESMKALTDPAALNLSYLVPATVPSGLPVDSH